MMASETLIFDPRGDVTLILSRKPEPSKAAPDSLPTNGTAPGLGEFLWTPVNMLVSSKHMSLASSVFEAMLKPNFDEGSTLVSSGMVEIPLPDDDPDLLAVLLNIIHGRNKKVPRVVGLDKLTRLTSLVDKYQMQEAIAAFAEIWIEGFNLHKETSTIERDTLRWLSISWIFENDALFERTSKDLMRIGDSEFDEGLMDELLIPEIVIERIKYERREGALASMLLVLQDLLGNFQKTDIACSQLRKKEFCDAMVLGSLLQGIQKARLWPFPEPPYEGLTVEGLKEAILAIEIKTLCDFTEPARGLEYYDMQWPTQHIQKHDTNDSDTIKEWIAKRINSISDNLSGLKIEDFKKN